MHRPLTVVLYPQFRWDCPFPRRFRSQSTLPKALFVGKAPISGKLKAAIGERIEIHPPCWLLARSANTGLADGKLIRKCWSSDWKLTAKATGIPNEVIDLIAGQRKSGIVFVCVRDVPFEGSTREECAFAVRRAHTRACRGTPIYQVYAGDWQPVGEASWSWPALLLMSCGHRCAHRPFWVRRRSENLDARIIRHTEIARLESEVDKAHS